MAQEDKPYGHGIEIRRVATCKWVYEAQPYVETSVFSFADPVIFFWAELVIPPADEPEPRVWEIEYKWEDPGGVQRLHQRARLIQMPEDRRRTRHIWA